MKALLVKPCKIPKVIDIEDDLESFQAIVGGYIESIYIDSDVAVICDEEGKLKGKRPNRYINKNLIVGDFIVCGVDGIYFGSLTNEQIAKYKKFFGSRSYI